MGFFGRGKGTAPRTPQPDRTVVRVGDNDEFRPSTKADDVDSQSNIPELTDFSAHDLQVDQLVRLNGKYWRIVAVNQGPEEGPEHVEDDHVYRTTAGLKLRREEIVKRPEPPVPPVEPTPVVVEVEDDEELPVKKTRFSARYGLVDISHGVNANAADAGAKELHRERKELKDVSGFFARVLKHNLFSEMFEQMNINRARTSILKEKNVFAANGGTREDHERAVAAVVDRFVAEAAHETEFLHDEGKGKEVKHILENTKEGVRAKERLVALLKEYAANPRMTDDELDARRKGIIADARKAAKDAAGQGLMYGDNVKELAEALRDAARHAGGVENLDIDIEFIVGKARMGARTEAEKNLVERVLEKLPTYGKAGGVVGGVLGAFYNEVTVAVAAMKGLGTIGARMGLGNAAASIATFGGSAAVTGLFSWWKEKGVLHRERALHEREMALGNTTKNALSQEDLDALAARRKALAHEYQNTPAWRPLKRLELRREIDSLYDAPQPRRERMEGFELARASARDMTQGAQAFFTPDGMLREDLDRQMVYDKLAEMDARVRLSDRKNVDLLTYSSLEAAEVERRDLDRVRMELKAALRKTDAEFERNYGNILLMKSNALLGDETSGVEGTDKRFAEYAQRRAMRVGATTAAMGAVIGFGMHEVFALANGSETVTGNMGKHLAWLRDYLLGKSSVGAVGAPEVHQIAGGVMNTPAGTHFAPQADGTFTFETLADHKPIVSGLHVGADGALDSASIDALKHAGAGITEVDRVIDHTQTMTDHVGPWEWLSEKATSVTHIHRDIWLGNDTPAPVFDFNELKLEWGDVAGISPDGQSFVMDMSHMTPPGSWQGTYHVDALKEMADGNMRLVLTLSEGTQNHAVEVVVNSHGQAVIPMDSDIARTFFTVQNGKAVFMGRYAEIALTRGFDAHGVDHLAVLATHQGKGVAEGVVTREIGECVTDHVTTISMPPTDNAPWILPPIIPIRPRRPLEPVWKKSPRRKGSDGPDDDGAGVVPPLLPGGPGEGLRGGEKTTSPVETGTGMYGQLDKYSPGQKKDIRQIFTERLSPTLRENPDAKLDFRKEFAWYRAEKIDGNLEYANDLARIMSEGDMSEPMSDECRIAPCIPVYALGEGKGIEHTLEQYRKQIENGSVRPEEFELILFLNYPKDRLEKLAQDLAKENKTMNGAEERVREGRPEAYDTAEVVRQYQQRHPEMKIRVMTKEFPTRPLWGWIIKYAYDAACIRAAARSNPKHSDLFIATNDCDLRDMSDRYLRILIDKFDANDERFSQGKEPHLDALSGRGDHDNETYKKWPNFFVSTRFEQFLAAQTRAGFRGRQPPQMDGYGNYLEGKRIQADRYMGTQGRNSILRASTYCAIGGARNERDAGADTELGDMILNARRGPNGRLTNARFPMEYINAAWIETDPRRELGTYKKGQAIADTWNDWEKMDVYGRSFAEVIRGDHEELNIDRLQMEMFEFMKRWHGLSPYSGEVETALTWLGLAGIETNAKGEPIDKNGDVITDGDESKFVKYKDYTIGEIEIPNEGGTKRKEWGIKITSLDHLRANLARWKPKRERVDSTRAKRVTV